MRRPGMVSHRSNSLNAISRMSPPQFGHEIGEPVEELKRQEVDDAVRPRPRGLSRAAHGDPVNRAVGPLAGRLRHVDHDHGTREP